MHFDEEQERREESRLQVKKQSTLYLQKKQVKRVIKDARITLDMESRLEDYQQQCCC